MPATAAPQTGPALAPPVGPDGGRPADPGEERRPRRRWGRRLVRAGVVLLVLAVLYLGFTFVQVWQASNRDNHPRADAIVVLGAAQYDGRPSPVLQARLDHALELYRDGAAPLIVVTGGRQEGDRFTEAGAGYNWMRARGVPDQDILQEVGGANTYQSLAAVRAFAGDQGIGEVVLVSDDFHAARLRAIAGETGLEAHVSPAGQDLLSGPGELRGLVRETMKVSVGRIIGYRRLSNLTEG